MPGKVQMCPDCGYELDGSASESTTCDICGWTGPFDEDDAHHGVPIGVWVSDGRVVLSTEDGSERHLKPARAEAVADELKRAADTLE